MTPEDEWDMTRSGRGSFFGIAGMGVLRIALLFGSAAIALALIIAPMMDSRPQYAGAEDGLDFTSTGSIGPRGSYTIRKSVLQDMPGALCVIQDNGRQIGDC